MSTPEPPPSSNANTETRVEEPIETPIQSSSPQGWAPPKNPLRTTILIAVCAVLAVAIVLYAWGLPPFTRATQSTDNAYVRGRTTLISPQVSGYVVAVPVQDYQHVAAGD